MRIITLLFLIVLFNGCCTSKEIKTIRNYRLETQIEESCFPSKVKILLNTKPLNGVCLIKKGLYSKKICNYKDGYWHGCLIKKKKKNIVFKGNYNNGIPNGALINYDENGIKVNELNYNKGLLKGVYVVYSGNGCDTSLVANIKFGYKGGEIYVQEEVPFESLAYMLINDYTYCGIISESIYPISYYLINDSTLIKTINFYKYNNKFFTKDQLKDLGVYN